MTWTANLKFLWWLPRQSVIKTPSTAGVWVWSLAGEYSMPLEWPPRQKNFFYMDVQRSENSQDTPEESRCQAFITF